MVLAAIAIRRIRRHGQCRLPSKALAVQRFSFFMPGLDIF